MSSSNEATANVASVPQTRDGSRRRLYLWIGALIVVILIAAGVIPRVRRQSRAGETANEARSSLPKVSLVQAKLAPGSAELELPGNTEPINVASIYARTNGYISARFVDIGSPVKSGQLLAKIDSPEIDQELAQARANLQQSRAALEQAVANLAQANAQVTQTKANVGQAKANEEIASTTNQRWTQLVQRGVLPKQQGDERRTAYDARVAETGAASAAQATAEANVNSRTADIAAARAAVDAQTANVRRLEQLQGFERVTAPFAGIVTERRVERGDLVSAGSGVDRNLFSVAQGNTLRIQIAVPQFYAVDLRQGQSAEIIVRERPGEKFSGQVARTAGSIATATRTLLTEVQVDNSSGRLLPGMYTQVKFSLPRARPVVIAPGSALLVGAKGTQVVIVGSDRHAHIASVQVGRDLGADVEIVAGLSGSERLANNPPDTLTDGQEVRPAQTEKAGAKERNP